MRVFDAHCDTISEMYEKKQDFAKNSLHIDFERMKKYEAYTQVFAVFTDPQKRAKAKEYENALIEPERTVLDINCGKYAGGSR